MIFPFKKFGTREHEERKKKEEKRLSPMKMTFIVTLIVGGLVFGTFMQRNSEKTKTLHETSKKSSLIDLTTIQNSGQNIANQGKVEGQKFAGIVLGAATKLAQSTASRSAEMVGDIVFHTTVGQIMKQVDKLPEKQKAELRSYMCK